jgi:hypothetical protein
MSRAWLGWAARKRALPTFADVLQAAMSESEECNEQIVY